MRYLKHSPERQTATTSMPSRIQITTSLQLAACMTSRHGPTDTPSRTSILAARVQAIAIVGGSNALCLPRGRAIDRFSSRHGDSVLQPFWRTIESKVRETTGGRVDKDQRDEDQQATVGPCGTMSFISTEIIDGP